MQVNDLSFWDLTRLTFQAVFQTVIICLLGYFAAKSKILTPTVQRHVSTLNVQLFTPCLIFSKLASSLSLEALIDIAVVPLLFVISTAVSYLSAKLVSRMAKFTIPEANFVTAMAVFGNSNSLPVTLTVSLAYTLPLEWPDIENDNADDVASRGLLYLLVFQQLGQILRWSWGYNTLLAKPEPADQYPTREDDEARLPLITENDNHIGYQATSSGSDNSDSNSEDADQDQDQEPGSSNKCKINNTHLTVNELPFSTSSSTVSLQNLVHLKRRFLLSQENLSMTTWKGRLKSIYKRVMAFMNIPLWSMLVAIMVASIPPIQREMFENEGFIQNTITKAITQLGGVAIPMILVVLGANLAPDSESKPTPNYPKIVLASLLARMVIPSLVMLPLIALSVKFIQVSILDDPIFLLAAFILTVAPPAIQLSQICQLNQVFEKEMAGVLFWGYVVLTLPTTIFIVVSSLKVLQWAGVTV